MQPNDVREPPIGFIRTEPNDETEVSDHFLPHGFGEFPTYRIRAGENMRRMLGAAAYVAETLAEGCEEVGGWYGLRGVTSREGGRDARS